MDKMIGKIYGMVQSNLSIEEIVEYSRLYEILKILDIDPEYFIKLYKDTHDIEYEVVDSD